MRCCEWSVHTYIEYETQHRNPVRVVHADCRLDLCAAASCPKPLQDAGQIGQSGFFGRLAFFFKKRQQIRRRSHVTAPTETPSQEVGVRVRGRGGAIIGNGQNWGRVDLGPRARLQLTTQVLYKFLCRMQLHIVHA